MNVLVETVIYKGDKIQLYCSEDNLWSAWLVIEDYGLCFLIRNCNSREEIMYEVKELDLVKRGLNRLEKKGYILIAENKE